MLWFRKTKVHEPFKDPNWNLINSTDFTGSATKIILRCPQNSCWELLYLNTQLSTDVLLASYVWLWIQARDYHLWTVSSTSSVPAGKTYNVCASQGIQGVRGGVNHEVMTVKLPNHLYMMPQDELVIYVLPIGAGTRLQRTIATFREWRIY